MEIYIILPAIKQKLIPFLGKNANQTPMTQHKCTIDYEKQFLINNFIRLPVVIHNMIKDFCFYDIETSKKIHFVRSKKREIVTYFEENMRFYHSIVCIMCGDFQLISFRRNLDPGQRIIIPRIRCECGEYSMWLSNNPRVDY